MRHEGDGGKGPNAQNRIIALYQFGDMGHSGRPREMRMAKERLGTELGKVAPEESCHTPHTTHGT